MSELYLSDQPISGNAPVEELGTAFGCRLIQPVLNDVVQLVYCKEAKSPADGDGDSDKAQQKRKTSARPEIPSPALNSVDILPGLAQKQEDTVGCTNSGDRSSSAGCRKWLPDENQPASLTADNMRAQFLAEKTLERYVALSNNGSKRITEEQLRIIKDEFELALKHARIDPHTLQSLSTRLQTELNKAIPDMEKQKAVIEKLQAADTGVQRAVKALPADKKDAFIKLEEKFRAEAVQLELRFGKSLPMFQHEMRKLEAGVSQEQAALSRDLGRAINARTQLLETPDGKAALTFTRNMCEIDRLYHSPAMIKFSYFQVLDKIGGVDNLEKSNSLLRDAMEDRKVLPFVVKYLKRQLDILQGYDGKTFPELVALRKAQEALADQTKDAFSRFVSSRYFFNEALRLTDRYERNIESLRESSAEIEAKLSPARKAVEAGERRFTPEEQKQLRDLKILKEKIENISMVRLQYAMAINHYGIGTKQRHYIQDDALEVLYTIKELDPKTFLSSPQIQQALRQAREGKRIDVIIKVSNAATDIDATTVAKTRTINGVTSDASKTSSSPQSDRGGSEEEILQRSREYLQNPRAAGKTKMEQAVQELQQDSDAASQDFLKNGSDFAALASGFLTKFAVERAMIKMPRWGKVAGIGLGLATAGLTKDVTHDGKIGDSKDWLRGGAIFGGALLATRQLAMSPSRQELSKLTSSAIEARLGLHSKDLLGRTGTELADMVLAGTNHSAGPIRNRALQYFNPVNYTGIGFRDGAVRYVGFGGERTAAALAAGEMSFASYNARRVIGDFANTAGSAYLFGAGQEALNIATGEPAKDGSLHTVDSALSQMNNSGMAYGATALLWPAAGAAFRLTPVGRGMMSVSASAGSMEMRAFSRGAQTLSIACVPWATALDRAIAVERLSRTER